MTEHMERTTAGMNPNADSGLWMIVIGWCRFIASNKHASEMQAADNVGQGIYGESLYLLLNSAGKIKLPLKKRSIENERKERKILN